MWRLGIEVFLDLDTIVQNQPLVSVIIPVYNGAAYLEKTILSILSQDYPFIECIVMDGGSTDGTTRILEHYKDRLVYISKPDAGAADAINQGFAIAHGSIWLYRCDRRQSRRVIPRA